MSSPDSKDGEMTRPKAQGEREISPQEELLRALVEGRLEEFEELLKKKEVNPYHKYQRRGTFLEIACRNNKGQFVQALLKEVKPYINSIIPEPIHYAAKVGANDAMTELLKYKRTDVNAVNSKGDTALHYLAQFYKPEDGYKKCMELLLYRSDIDINKPNKKGFTPIHQAAFYGRKEMVNLILNLYKKDLDLDSHTGSGRTARAFLVLKYPDLVPQLPPVKYNASRGYENQLLVAFQNQHFEVFCGLLRQVDDDGNPIFDPNFRYGRPLNETCLEMACRQKGSQKFLKALLEAGADPNNVNQTNFIAPVHVAAETLNYEALETLLHHPGTDVNVVDMNGWSALHYATAQPSQQSDNSEKCIKLLLKKMKVKNANTMIELASSKGNMKALELFKNLKCEENVQSDIIAELFGYLHNQQPEEFISKFKDTIGKKDKKMLECIEVLNPFFLYLAIESDLVGVVQILLENDANPNVTICGPPPLVMAAKQQNIHILKQLLKASSVDVDATDMKGDTALHYAVRAENMECSIALLNNGASINKGNVLGKTPLTLNGLETFLDRSLRTNDQYNPEHVDYEVIFDYTLLTAGKTKNVIGNSKLKTSHTHLAATDVTTLNIGETQVDQATELHPLFNQICAANITATSSENSSNHIQGQVAGIEDIVAGLKAETQILHYLSNNNKEYRGLLDHPIIDSFLQFKWDCVKYFFYSNVFLYLLFFISLNGYIMFSSDANGNCTSTTNSLESNESIFIHSDCSVLCYTFWILLIILTVLISLREIFQLCMSTNKLVFYICGFRVDIIPRYFRDSENYLDLSILGITWSIIVLPSDDCSRSTLNVFAILLSAWELILLLGRCPIFSRNIEMLKSVTITYCWLLLTFLSIILAFSHCFYIVFRKNMLKDNINAGLWALCKTIVLMTGEYDAHSLDFDSMPFESIIVFLLFVFFISIVLLNLLIGLSVNNTKVIEDKSEVLCITSRIHVIYKIESTVLKCKQCFPNYKFVDVLTKSVLLFPESQKDKLVRTLQNRDGRIRDNPFFHSELRKRLHFICFHIRNGLRCLMCKKLKKCEKSDKCKMGKNILDEAVRILGRSQDTSWSDINEQKRSLVKQSIKETLDNLNNILN